MTDPTQDALFAHVEPAPKLPDTVTLHHGDCREALARLDDASIDAIVCDPPYALTDDAGVGGFMGKGWDAFGRHEDAGFGYYLAGLIDGEGSFRVTANTSGHGYRCEFSLTLRDDDEAILRRAQQYLGGAGNLRRHDGSGNARPLMRWSIDAKDDCIELVRCLLKYPLRAKKLHDFIVWAEAVEEWSTKPRGNRWQGASDWSRMAALKARIEGAREYREVPWSGHAFQDWCRSWAEQALRVLKPGGHLLAFGGTRTYHRLAAGIEDAGFDIRDSIHWLYASGFPKSLNVGKAIDKLGGNIEYLSEMAAAITAAREARGMTVRECDEHFCGGSSAWPFYEGRMLNGRLAIQIPNADRADRIVDEWPELAPAFARLRQRGEHLGSVIHPRGGSGDFPKAVGSGAAAKVEDVYALGTDEAAAWDGWGTALKPAHEPIVVARKPLVGTVAANVLAHGTGALNIDGCRVGYEAGGSKASNPSLRASISGGNGGHIFPAEDERRTVTPSPDGRWPPNVVLTHHDDCRKVGTATDTYGGGMFASGGFADGYQPGDGYDGTTVTIDVWDCDDSCPAAELDTQSGVTRSRPGVMPQQGRSGGILGAPIPRPDAGNPMGYDDAGGASRFFPSFQYAAKTSTAERNAGLSRIEPRFAPTMGNGIDGKEHDPATATPKANVHPTVKPVDLMRWLVRLVTPPGGTVCDPFLGSGTTGMAAVLEGFRFVGIEREAEYLAIAEARIAFAGYALRRSHGWADGWRDWL